MANRSNAETFIAKAKLKHGKKFDYSKVKYENSREKVKIICSNHGVFVQSPENHVQGQGCPKCCSNAPMTTKDFIKKSISVHGDTYSYRKTVYVSAMKKVEIVCSKHGSFFQKPSDHLSKCGCPKCKGDSISLSRKATRLTTEQFKLDARKIHGNAYSYDKVDCTKSVQVEIVCPRHGTFSQNMYFHLRGSGCTGCCGKRFSNIAVKWIEQAARSLRMKNVLHAKNGGEFRIPGTCFKVDGYHERTKTVFEFHGDVFHGNPKLFKPRSKPNPFSDKTAQRLYRETLAREEKIKALGYNLVVMWENDFKLSNKGKTK